VIDRVGSFPVLKQFFVTDAIGATFVEGHIRDDGVGMKLGVPSPARHMLKLRRGEVSGRNELATDARLRTILLEVLHGFAYSGPVRFDHILASVDQSLDRNRLRC